MRVGVCGSVSVCLGVVLAIFWVGVVRGPQGQVVSEELEKYR